jgi:DNA ligase 1
MSLHKVFGIFNQFTTHGSKTVKEQILKNNESDTDFREALYFLLNKFIVTGISTKKMKKKVELKGSYDYQPIQDLNHLITYLKENNSGRDFDIAVIQEFIEKQESDEIKDFIRKFVTKDLKLGISAKTANKVYGKGSIPSFEVQLAESFEKKESKITGKFYVTLKLDGNRCIAINGEDGVKFYTRSGKVIEGMKDLERDFKHLPKGWTYDGEILLRNDDNLKSDELYRLTQKVARKDGVKRDLEFHIFDMLPTAHFKNGKSENTYEQRRNQLNLLGQRQEFKECENVTILPVLYEGTDKSIIPVIMKEVEAQGFEGLMINTAKGIYQSKRTTDLQKVKTFKSADLLVMSIEKAIDGQFEGLMGRANVEYKGNIVGVGSGFTLEQRREFIDSPDLIVGSIIEVQFFEESKDEKTGQPSMRFPTFKGIRDDKTVDDIRYE